MKTPEILKRVSETLDDAIVKEFRTQGHSLTGATEESIKGKIMGDRVEGQMNDSGLIVNAGTNSNRIPYNRGSGGKKSKYIDGLTNFFMLKGLPEKEARKAAFATAQVQKREGMSTLGSRKFSKSGKRQQFIEIASTRVEKQVDSIVLLGMDEIFNTEFHKQKDEKI